MLITERCPRMAVAIVLVAGALLSGITAGADASKGSPGPQACGQGGYQHLYRQDATGFSTHRDCVAYASHGGRLAKFTLAVDEIDCGSTNICFTPIISGFGLLPGSFVRVTAYTASGDRGPVSFGAGVFDDGTVKRDAGDVSVGCGAFLTGSATAYVVGTAVTAEGATITLPSIPTPWCSP